MNKVVFVRKKIHKHAYTQKSKIYYIECAKNNNLLYLSSLHAIITTFYLQNKVRKLLLFTQITLDIIKLFCQITRLGERGSFLLVGKEIAISTLRHFCSLKINSSPKPFLESRNRIRKAPGRICCIACALFVKFLRYSFDM